MNYEIIAYDKLRSIKVSVMEVRAIRSHLHREIEVILVLKGTLRVTTEQSEIEVGENAILIFGPRQSHALTATGESALLLVEHFSPDLYQSYFPMISSVVFRNPEVSQHMPARQAWELRDWILLLSNTYVDNQQNYNQFLCVSISGWILHDILCWNPWHTGGPDASCNIRINRIVDHIHANYMERLMLADFAAAEGLTVAYLSHYFKEQIGMSFQAYVALIRFEHAKTYLEQTDMTLTEICLCCGISDVRYMNKMFLKYAGCTANEYRQARCSPSTVLRRHPIEDQYRILTEEESVTVLEAWSGKQDWSVGSRLRYLNEMDLSDESPAVRSSQT